MWGLRLVLSPLRLRGFLVEREVKKTITFSVQHTTKTTASSVAVCIDTCDLFYM